MDAPPFESVEYLSPVSRAHTVTARVVTVRAAIVAAAVIAALVAAPGVARASSPIHSAAAAGNVKQLTSLLKKKPELANARDAQGRTPLHEAVAHDRAKAVELLIAKGADVNAVAEDHVTPLIVAVTAGNMSIAMTLLDHGADPNLMSDHGGGPLHIASAKGNAAIVLTLLSKGANVNLQDRNEGWSPSFHAAFYKRPEILEILLANGGDASLSGHRGTTLLHVAASSGNPDVVRLTLVKLVGAQQAKLGAHAMDTTMSVANVPDTRGRTALFEAVRIGSLPVAEELVNLGADPNFKDEFGATPMSEAVQNGNAEMVALLRAHGGK